MFTQFFNTAKRFGLTVSQKKTETMFQSYPLSPVMAGETQLTPVDKFCCLDNYLSNTMTADVDINSRLAFGKLLRRLGRTQRLVLPTKIAVYQAVLLSTLLYGCESWVLRRRSVRRLDKFRMRCLRKIAVVSNGRTECRTRK